MKDSTGLAERLGAIRFHELLNAFFRDIADAALECDAEIHKYVGDEAILTWPAGRALSDGRLPHLPVSRPSDFIVRNAARYRDSASAPSRSSVRRCIAARSSPAKSATCGARSPMSATR